MRLDNADWPTFGWIADVRPALRKAAQGGRSVVLATLVGREGPAPRPVGTQMLFDGTAATGYFSGGCMEADIANHAAACLDDGQPRHLVYGNGSPWIDIRLTCGGRLEILLERISPDDPAVATLLEFESDRRPARWESDGRFRRALDALDASERAEPAGTGYSLLYRPTWRLAVWGSDPIALAIAELAAATGFDTLLIRPDQPSLPSPFPAIRCIERAAAASNAFAIDHWTAVVAATHDDATDDEAVRHALRGGAFYAGVLGAAARCDRRLARLADAGVHADLIALIRSPIGVAGCGNAPREIAVSVIAEILQARPDNG